jgi:flagellar assembly protein FliH
MSLSKGPGFSSVELASLSAWNLPDISEHTVNCHRSGKSESVNIEEAISPILTVAEIETMQKQAYEEAFSQGKIEGYQQGFDQGFAEGTEKGYQENSELLLKKTTVFADLIESLNEPFKNLDDEVEKELVQLSIGIATQIIRREIKLDPGQIIAAVRETINVLPLSSQKIHLRLHPEDAELVRSALFLDETSTSWAIIEDPLITRGGCKADTDVSHIDATVEHRLAAVIATILGGERARDGKDPGAISSDAQRAAQEQPTPPAFDTLSTSSISTVANESMDAGGIPSGAQGATQGRQTAPAFAAFSTSCTSAVADNCTDAGGRATQGAVAEDNNRDPK